MSSKNLIAFLPNFEMAKNVAKWEWVFHISQTFKMAKTRCEMGVGLRNGGCEMGVWTVFINPQFNIF